MSTRLERLVVAILHSPNITRASSESFEDFSKFVVTAAKKLDQLIANEELKEFQEPTKNV